MTRFAALLVALVLAGCAAFLPPSANPPGERAAVEASCAGPENRVEASGIDREGRIVYRCVR
jgi:hypothetical protein